MKLSVCIPVYNVAPYVEQCARSLFGQTYEDMEFLFVDDATPDDSIGIVRRVLADYPARQGQVKVLRHETNRGLVAARKTAIRAATGDLITHCDSDDWVDPDLYAKMVARMEEEGADAVLCSTRRHLPGRVLLSECPDRLRLSGCDAMRRTDEIPALNAMMTKVFRRECVDLDAIECPDSICIAEDYCHVMQVLPRCRLLTSVSGAYYNYRVNANSMTRSRNVRRLVDHHAQVYDILTRRLPGDVGVVPRRNLVRPVLYWGVVFGLLSTAAFEKWRGIYAGLGGRWDWSDMSLWGQRMMKLAERSLVLSRLASPFTRGKVDDLL